MNKEQIKTRVQEEFKNQIMNPKETVVTEGVIRRVLHSLTGATLGAFGGGGAAVGIAAGLFALGVIIPVIPAWLAIPAASLFATGATGIGGLAGFIAGRRSAINVDRRRIETSIQDLIDSIKERDEVIRELEQSFNDESTVSMLEREFDRLTRIQISAATELEKLVDDEKGNPEWDSTLPRADFVRKQYDVITQEILPVAVYGKATFLDPKETEVSATKISPLSYNRGT
jgi:hypothetical protein